MEHTLGSIYLDEKDTVWMTFKKNSELTINQVDEFFILWEKVCQGKKRPFIIDFRETFASVRYEFLEKISSDSRAFEWRKAEAVLIDSLSLRLMANFYKGLGTTKIPVKIFTDEQEAINWVKKI